MKYYKKKEFLKPKKTDFAYLFFDNGDYVTLNKSEIVDYNFEFYDKMIWYQDNITPVAKSGFAKFKISKYKSSRYDSTYMNVNDEYNKNRKKYLENRCVNENGIESIAFFDAHNWHKTVVGKFKAKVEQEYLILTVEDIWPNVSSKDVNYSIELNPIKKLAIERINIDFENCETFDVFQEEIVGLNIVLDAELEYGSDNYNRTIKSGYIKIKFNPKITWRHASLFCDRNKPTLKQIKKRLCKKDNQKENQNICNLYIYYQYAGFGNMRRERISLEPIDFDNYDEDDDNYDGDDDNYEYISSYCEVLEDGCYIIYLGKKI